MRKARVNEINQELSDLLSKSGVNELKLSTAIKHTVE